MSKEPQFPEAELARLADGSLPREREADLRAQIQGSPALRGALAEQERAVSLIRSTDQVTAPDSLRARLEELTAGATQPVKQPRRRPRWRFGFGIPALAGAVAAAAVAAVLVIGGGSSAPTLHQTARVALASSTQPPPLENRADPGALDVKVDGIPFPYWGGSVGWPAVGQRVDTVGGRRVVTVFYRAKNGARIGYAIVSGSPVPVRGGKWITQGGKRYTLFNAGGARAITWRRDGHTCVIAGRGVSDKTLVALANADERVSLANWSSPAGVGRTATI